MLISQIVNGSNRAYLQKNIDNTLFIITVMVGDMFKRFEFTDMKEALRIFSNVRNEIILSKA